MRRPGSESRPSWRPRAMTTSGDRHGAMIRRRFMPGLSSVTGTVNERTISTWLNRISRIGKGFCFVTTSSNILTSQKNTVNSKRTFPGFTATTGWRILTLRPISLKRSRKRQRDTTNHLKKVFWPILEMACTNLIAVDPGWESHSDAGRVS